MQKKPITTADVMARYGLRRTAVHNLDHVLKPRRSETGVRIFDDARVDFIGGARAAGAR